MTELNNLSHIERPLPPIRSYSQPFWDGTRAKRLLIQFDREVGAYQFFPRPTSIYTGRRSALEWREVSGEGNLFSYTTADRPPATFVGAEPYLIVLITLDEQVNVMSNLVRCRLEDVTVGMRVRLCWAPLADGRHFPMFEPAPT